MTTIEQDYARYMARKRLYDDARHALNALLKDEDARRHIGHTMEGYAAILEEELGEQSAHIVAVWD